MRLEPTNTRRMQRTALSMLLAVGATVLSSMSAFAGSDAEQILRRFAPRAFRRPVRDEELLPYLNLIQSRIDKGYSIDAALRVGLTGILCSPVSSRELPR